MLDPITQDAACFFEDHVVIRDEAGAVAVTTNAGKNVERCCRVQLMVEASGVKPVTLTPEVARYSHEHVGNEFIGWLHFQPIFEQLVQTQPDMFD